VRTTHGAHLIHLNARLEPGTLTTRRLPRQALPNDPREMAHHMQHTALPLPRSSLRHFPLVKWPAKVQPSRWSS